MEEYDNKVEKFDAIIEPTSQIENLNTTEESTTKKARGFYFPTAYTILIVLELVIFILTYIVPKGKFHTIEYKEGKFIINRYYTNSTPEPETVEANETVLEKLGVKIKFENFEQGYIKKAISIPGTYTRLVNEENQSFFLFFTYPIYGMIDSADIAFVLMMIGGCINILVEMKALTSGMEALGRLTRGHELILLIAVVILVSIGGSTFGMCEEVLSFYPVLLPIFIKSGLDGGIAASSLFVAEQVGNMFSTVNPFAAGIGSYSAGISFIDGIVLRVIGFVIVDALTVGYFYFYHRRVRADPLKSAVYDIKDELIEKYSKDKKEQSVKINDGDDLQELVEQYGEFTIIQKISLILFGLSFVLLIVGVSAIDWWFEQISAIFLFLGIILIFLARKGEVKGIELFTKGAGDFAGVIIIIGLARGINITLSEGLISDTLLNGLSSLVDGLPKVVFAIIILLVFIILGFFIQSSSGLAVLSMPVFAPLADNVGVSRALIVNAYMFGQGFIGLLAPTGMCLIVLQLVGLKYTHWLKFSWMLIVVLFVYLILLMILEALIE